MRRRVSRETIEGAEGERRQKETMIRSKATIMVLATEDTEGTEQRRQEGTKKRNSENAVFFPSHRRFSLCY